jgi:hypothetical protein
MFDRKTCPHSPALSLWLENATPPQPSHHLLVHVPRVIACLAAEPLPVCQRYVRGEVSLAAIVAGKRVRPFDNPAHVVCDVIEKAFPVAGFQIPKNLVKVSSSQRLIFVPPDVRCHLRRTHIQMLLSSSSSQRCVRVGRRATSDFHMRRQHRLNETRGSPSRRTAQDDLEPTAVAIRGAMSRNSSA